MQKTSRRPPVIGDSILSRPSQFDVVDDSAKASRLQSLALMAIQLALTALATVAAGLYVFPLQ